MSRNMSDGKKKYTRTLWGVNSAQLACKVWLLSDYVTTSGNGALEILPLTFELNTENFHRVVKVVDPFDAVELKETMDRIEKFVSGHPEYWKDKK